MSRFVKFPVKKSMNDSYQVVWINVDNILSIETHSEKWSVIYLSGLKYFTEGSIEEVKDLLTNDYD